MMANDVRGMRIRCHCLSLRRTCVCQGATYTAIVGAWASVGDPAQAEAGRVRRARQASRVCNSQEPNKIVALVVSACFFRMFAALLSLLLLRYEDTLLVWTANIWTPRRNFCQLHCALFRQEWFGRMMEEEKATPEVTSLWRPSKTRNPLYQTLKFKDRF